MKLLTMPSSQWSLENICAVPYRLQNVLESAFLLAITGEKGQSL